MRFFIFTFALLLCMPTFAADYKSILDLPDGATLVNFSATERQVVAQDLLIATMRFEHESEKPRDVQNEINKTMQKALDRAKAYKTIKVATLQYNVYQYDANQGKKNLAPKLVWKGEQGLHIKGKVQDDVLKFVGELQDLGLSMNNLSYEVSPELLEETRDQMLETALEKLTRKADRTAKAIGKTSAEMKEINIDTGGGYRPQPVYAKRSMMMDASAESMSAPVASAGESDITLTVNAQALLK